MTRTKKGKITFTPKSRTAKKSLQKRRKLKKNALPKKRKFAQR